MKGAREARFTSLLASIVGLAMLAPFLRGGLLGQLVFDALFSCVLISAVWSVTGRLRGYLVGLAALAFAASALLYLHETQVVSAAAIAADILFCFVTTAAVLRIILADREVSLDTIAGAVAAYFLLGIGWAYIYGAIEMFQPGSFRIPEVLEGEASLRVAPLLRHLTYYSFVTLTTLGYGDIVPVGAVARNFSILEAVAGQFYLATLIARLVAVHTALSYRGGSGKS
jgi:hypothetical protein